MAIAAVMKARTAPMTVENSMMVGVIVLSMCVLLCRKLSRSKLGWLRGLCQLDQELELGEVGVEFKEQEGEC